MLTFEKTLFFNHCLGPQYDRSMKEGKGHESPTKLSLLAFGRHLVAQKYRFACLIHESSRLVHQEDGRCPEHHPKAPHKLALPPDNSCPPAPTESA